MRIIAVKSRLPEHRLDAVSAERAFMAWLTERPELERQKARRILRHCGVETRHSCLTLEEIFRACSLTESMTRYRKHARELGVGLLDETLRGAGVAPRDVDVLVTTSCTGFMIPSVDAFMAADLGMRADVLRVPVTQMGCAAGASALMYAAELLRGRGGGVAAVVNVELPTNTMQLEDFSLDNIVSTALFSDGLSCSVLRCGEAGGAVGVAGVEAWATHQVPDSLELLGYNLTSSGFRMTLHPSLPEVIERHFEAAADAVLTPRGMSLRDVRHFVIHPGGVKILDRIEPILQRVGGSTRLSREVMRDCGNMSSSTVGVILQRLLDSAPEPGPALLMSFGPGFGAHTLLLSIGGPGPA